MPSSIRHFSLLSYLWFSFSSWNLKECCWPVTLVHCKVSRFFFPCCTFLLLWFKLKLILWIHLFTLRLLVMKVYPGQRAGGIEADKMAANELSAHALLQVGYFEGFWNISDMFFSFLYTMEDLSMYIFHRVVHKAHVRISWCLLEDLRQKLENRFVIPGQIRKTSHNCFGHFLIWSKIDEIDVYSGLLFVMVGNIVQLTMRKLLVKKIQKALQLRKTPGIVLIKNKQ